MFSELSVLAGTGIVLGTLILETIILIVLEIPTVKTAVKKVKNKIRHFFWKCFNCKSDFVEK